MMPVDLFVFLGSVLVRHTRSLRTAKLVKSRLWHTYLYTHPMRLFLARAAWHCARAEGQSAGPVSLHTYNVTQLRRLALNQAAEGELSVRNRR